MTSLKGKVAIVTGGNSGIGFSAAKELKEKGAHVIITGRRKSAVEEAAWNLGVTGLVVDQGNMTDLDYLVSEVVKIYEKVDILLINAGTTQLAPIEATDARMFDSIMNVNFKGAYFTLSKFIPLLRDGASVVLLSSTSATVAAPGISVYSASKAALNALMKVAALELAPRNIRVNAVSPGPIATEILGKIGLTAGNEHLLLKGIPMARLGKPDEVAKLISYLTDESSSFITGSEFFIDGGHSINK